MRFLETVAVWLLIIGFFAGLGVGVWFVTKDAAARIDETLARAGTRSSVIYSAEPVVAPGLGEPPPVAAAEPFIVEGKTVTPPRWEILPDPDYPVSDGEMVAGTVALLCMVSDTGVLTQCRILQETPEGRGFGTAALEAAQRARLRPRTIDGVPTEGEVRFSIRFTPR